MGARKHFSTRTHVLVIVFFALGSMSLALGDGLPETVLLASRNIPATVKVTEDENRNLEFDISPQGEKPVSLVVPPSMTKTLTTMTKKGLIPKKSPNNNPPEPCYFDSASRFIEVRVTHYPAQASRLYTIIDHGYANRHPGTTPQITFQVLTPNAPLSSVAPKKPARPPCELHVLFDDGVPKDANEPLLRADPDSCEPWYKTNGPDAEKMSTPPPGGPPSKTESAQDVFRDIVFRQDDFFSNPPM